MPFSGTYGYGDLAADMKNNETFKATGTTGTNTPAMSSNGELIAGTGAANNTAYLLSAEYNNWKETYVPVELNLLNQSSINNPSVLSNAVNDATAATASTYATLQGVGERKLAAQGIQATPQQQAVSARVQSLSQAAAMAGAQNKSRNNVATEDQQISVGSSPNPNVAAYTTSGAVSTTSGG